MKLSEIKNLNSGLPRVLYHGSPFFQLLSILASDSIWGSSHDGEVMGVSTTSDINVAPTFSKAPDEDNPAGGIIALDTAKVQSSYKLVTGDSAWDIDDDEQEIVIRTKVLKPLSTYMLYFICPDHIIDAALAEEDMDVYQADMLFDSNVARVHKAVEMLKTLSLIHI